MKNKNKTRKRKTPKRFAAMMEPTTLMTLFTSSSHRRRSVTSPLHTHASSEHVTSNGGDKKRTTTTIWTPPETYRYVVELMSTAEKVLHVDLPSVIVPIVLSYLHAFTFPSNVQWKPAPDIERSAEFRGQSNRQVMRHLQHWFDTTCLDAESELMLAVRHVMEATTEDSLQYTVTLCHDAALRMWASTGTSALTNTHSSRYTGLRRVPSRWLSHDDIKRRLAKSSLSPPLSLQLMTESILSVLVRRGLGVPTARGFWKHADTCAPVLHKGAIYMCDIIRVHPLLMLVSMAMDHGRPFHELIRIALHYVSECRTMEERCAYALFMCTVGNYYGWGANRHGWYGIALLHVMNTSATLPLKYTSKIDSASESVTYPTISQRIDWSIHAAIRIFGGYTKL